MAKDLSNESLRLIPGDGATHLPCSCNAKAADLEFVREDEQREEPTVNLDASVVYSQVVGPPPNMLSAAKAGQA